MRNLAAVIIATVVFASPVLANVYEDVNATSPQDPGPPAQGTEIWQGARDVLFDNGPVATHFGTGIGGADESWLQTALGLSIYGFGHQVTAQNWVGDDFVVPAGEDWTVDGINFFAYQTGAPTNPSPITVYYVLVWDDWPGFGNVVWGDTSTNRLLATQWSNIYRVRDTDTGQNSDRAIFANLAETPGLVLGSGTYWISWQVDGMLSSGPWCPPVTILGETTTGNGVQSTDGGIIFNPVDDNGFPQGFPFIIEGTVGGTPTDDATWGEIKSLFQ
jgi:hypothetical protein